MLLFHGTTKIIPTPEIRQSNYPKEYGTGFYCTYVQEDSERWAKKRSLAESAPEAVNVYRFKENIDLNVLKFSPMTEEWLEFVLACRKGASSHAYDLILGPILGRKNFALFMQLEEGSISREAFWALVDQSFPTAQMCFCTEKALTALEYLETVGRDKNNRWLKAKDQREDLVFTCAVIEHLGRESKNPRSVVSEALGQERIGRVYDLADVYCCEPLEKLANELSKEIELKEGSFDNIDDSDYGDPGLWNIARVYQRLVEQVLLGSPEKEVEQVIMSVFCSDVSDWIQDYNCDWYCSDPKEIYQAYCRS